MRTFFAVPMNGALQKVLERKLAVLQTQEWASQVSWTSAINWHLTIKFLGEVTIDQANAIEASMNDWFAAGMSYFEAEVVSIKGFPQPKSGPFIVASLDSTLLLQALVREVEDQLRSFGFLKDKRAFRPHITLGKWHGEREAFPELGVPLEEAWLRVDRLNFYESVQKHGQHQYQTLATLPLETYD